MYTVLHVSLLGLKGVYVCRYSPSLLGLKVLEHRPVRRAKLYYLRDRKPSEYRVQ